MKNRQSGSTRAAVWEAFMFAAFALLGCFGVIYGIVGGESVDVAWGMGALAFAKASRAMAWLHRGRDL